MFSGSCSFIPSVVDKSLKCQFDSRRLVTGGYQRAVRLVNYLLLNILELITLAKHKIITSPFLIVAVSV